MPYKRFPPLEDRSVSLHASGTLTEASLPCYRPILPYGTLGDFLETLPAGSSVAPLRKAASWLRRARQADRVTWLGLDLDALAGQERGILLDLMARGWVSALSMSARLAWRDFHVCLCGEGADLGDEAFWSGTWGLAEESGLLWSVALREGASREGGLGEALGAYLMESSLPGVSLSLLAGAYRLNIPVTVHGGAVLPDWIHHPRFEPETAQRVQLRDQNLLSSVWARVIEGGIPVVLGGEGVLRNALSCAQAHLSALGHRASMKGLVLGAGADEEAWRQALRLSAPSPELLALGRDRDTLIPLLAALLLVPASDG